MMRVEIGNFALGARVRWARVLCLVASAWFAAVLLAAAMPARAEDFPSRPIHLIIPYGPGGIVDFTGRQLAQKMSENLGQPVVADNRPGAGGIVGIDYVAHSDPDGYNVVLMDPAIVINPTLQKSLPYDIFKDLVTVSRVSSSPEVLVVAPQLGFKSYADLVAYGKANPGKLNYASAGVGTAPHLAAAMWAAGTGIQAVHVPYKGIGGSFTDMMDNKVQMAFSSIPGALPFTSTNRVQALATTGLKRSPIYPDLPTVAESGLPGYDVDVWMTLYGRAGMPPDVLAKLNSSVKKALQDPALIAAFAKFGLTPVPTNLADSAAFTKSEYEKWKKVIKDNHITLD
ncbi:MAG TPA: tripartite tricarboxylate transporter substrate binding protein [Xanthobacteraceae bacterium]|nr:tripartite tricarboxylate transporter substrate binding protein [Xanthobacteraceae bacterium]